MPTNIAIREMLACWKAAQQLGIADDERPLHSANAWRRCRPKTVQLVPINPSNFHTISLALHIPFQERKFVYILKCSLYGNFHN